MLPLPKKEEKVTACEAGRAGAVVIILSLGLEICPILAIGPNPLRPPFHSRRVRVLHFEPIGRAAGAVRRALALGHKAFEPELAGVAEDGPAVALDCSFPTSRDRSVALRLTPEVASSSIKFEGVR
jgi:hypothetical protein